MHLQRCIKRCASVRVCTTETESQICECPWGTCFATEYHISIHMWYGNTCVYCWVGLGHVLDLLLQIRLSCASRFNRIQISRWSIGSLAGWLVGRSIGSIQTQWYRDGFSIFPFDVCMCVFGHFSHRTKLNISPITVVSSKILTLPFFPSFFGCRSTPSLCAQTLTSSYYSETCFHVATNFLSASIFLLLLSPISPLCICM